MADNNDRILHHTDDGIFYSVEGNIVTLFNFQQKLIEALRKTPVPFHVEFPSIDKVKNFSLKDFYSPEMNTAFMMFNPPMADETLFYRSEDGQQIGLRYVIFDTETDETENRIIYRNTVGDLMEIIYIIAHIGQTFTDKRQHVYKFGTVYGVNEAFNRYMTLIEESEGLENMRRVMYYIAGIVKGVCRETAYTSAMMMNTIERVVEQYSISKLVEEANNEDGDDE